MATGSPWPRVGVGHDPPDDDEADAGDDGGADTEHDWDVGGSD